MSPRREQAFGDPRHFQNPAAGSRAGQGQAVGAHSPGSLQDCPRGTGFPRPGGGEGWGAKGQECFVNEVKSSHSSVLAVEISS